MATKWMKMAHPDLPDNDPVVVTEEAFEALYWDNGWVEYVDPEPDPNSVAVPRDFTKPKPKPKKAKAKTK